MGWASAGEIFDVVAQGLISANADERVKRATLGPLIDYLAAEDWDTQDESVERFRTDPVVLELFAARGLVWNDEAGDYHPPTTTEEPSGVSGC